MFDTLLVIPIEPLEPSDFSFAACLDVLNLEILVSGECFELSTSATLPISGAVESTALKVS